MLEGGFPIIVMRRVKLGWMPFILTSGGWGGTLANYTNKASSSQPQYEHVTQARPVVRAKTKDALSRPIVLDGAGGGLSGEATSASDACKY